MISEWPGMLGTDRKAVPSDPMQKVHTFLHRMKDEHSVCRKYFLYKAVWNISKIDIFIYFMLVMIFCVTTEVNIASR